MNSVLNQSISSWILTFDRSISETSSGLFLSNGEILFSEEVMGGLRATVKAEKLRDKEGIYAMKELRVQNEDNKKFIDNFVSRMKVSEKPRSSFNQ